MASTSRQTSATTRQVEEASQPSNSSTTAGTTTTASTKRRRSRPLRKGGDDDRYNDYDESSSQQPPSITFSLFFSWILPVLAFAAFSRYAVDSDNLPTIETTKMNSGGGPTAKTKIAASQSGRRRRTSSGEKKTKTAPTTDDKRHRGRQRQPTAVNKKLSELPTSYREVVETIRSRRKKLGILGGALDIDDAVDDDDDDRSKKKKKKRSDGSSAGRGGREQHHQQHDVERKRALEIIAKKREAYRDDPNSLDNALGLADSLRLYELSYHQGGMFEQEAIEMYDVVVDMATKSKQLSIEKGESTKPTMRGRTVNDEVTLDYGSKSPDGLLCGVLCSQGKVYYMANMFEKAVESYTKCLDDVDSNYLDALNSRGSALIILGDYEQAASDFLRVVDEDKRLLFADAYTGLARVLAAKEDAAPPGTWDKVATALEELILNLQSNIDDSGGGGGGGSKQILASTLNRLHHVMFTYHDSKTKSPDDAWRHLQESYRYKMMILPEWNDGFEALKVKQTREVFKKGFWTHDAGSQTQVPIFVVGFVRSGSTLLERVLDAHPQIVGTGENSIFNGRLDEIRNKIVEVSMTGQTHMLGQVTEELAESVVEEMRRRWEVIDANTVKQDESEDVDPQRFVDKMLTNYYNIGFIHLLYPKALILHVAREPMDTLFSAYKHEFPGPGTLDYTSDVKPLAELYHAYRDLIEHWDEVLPGRVTHVRYEDMVHDMPNVARAIIAATGLEWDDSVLDFHRKKQAVNTLSTTQVRKGIYKDSLQSWRRYEKQLQPLVKLIGDRVNYNLKTSLARYKRSTSNSDGGQEPVADQAAGDATASAKDEL